MRSNLNVIILKSLMDGDKYGYEIIKEVEEKTDGQLVIKQPSLYSSLSRMEKQKFITSYWRDSDIGGKRHYYSLTDEGRDEFEKNSFNWENSKGLVASILTTSAAKKTDEPKEPEFNEFDPVSARENIMQKSFSAKSREYVKPENNYPEYGMPSSAISEKKVEYMEQPTPRQTSTAQSDSVAHPLKSTGTQLGSNTQLSSAQQASARQVPSYVFENPSAKMPEELAPTYQSNTAFSKNYSTHLDVSARAVESIKDNKSTSDIDYKDILGELYSQGEQENISLHALPPSSEVKTSRSSVLHTPFDSSTHGVKPINSFAKQFEKVLLKSAEEQKQPAPATREQSQMGLKEFASKYGGTYESREPEKPAPLESKKGKESPEHAIAQGILDFVTIKPHQKMFDADIKSRKFININKLRVIKATVIFALMLIETLILYFVLNSIRIITPTDYIVYAGALVFSVAYMLIYLIVFAKDPNKKVKANLNFKRISIIRSSLGAGLIASIFGVCILCGMQDLYNIMFYSKWLLLVVLSVNVFVGILIEYGLSFSTRLRA